MGRLASIHSQGASRVLSSYVTRQSDGANTWIGLRDDEHVSHQGGAAPLPGGCPGHPPRAPTDSCVVPPRHPQTRQWKWSDNSAFDYKRWDRGQPNNLWDKEDCVVLDKLSGEPGPGEQRGGWRGHPWWG